MSSPLHDTDLSGMTPEGARDYVLGFIKSLKETQRQRSKLVEELDLWTKRIELAERENRPELAEQARGRVASIRVDEARLAEEEEELIGKVGILKENLQSLPAGFQPAVDAELLLAQLEMVVGERDETAEQFKEMKAQSKLEELKRKIKDEKKGD